MLSSCEYVLPSSRQKHLDNSSATLSSSSAASSLFLLDDSLSTTTVSSLRSGRQVTASIKSVKPEGKCCEKTEGGGTVFNWGVTLCRVFVVSGRSSSCLLWFCRVCRILMRQRDVHVLPFLTTPTPMFYLSSVCISKCRLFCCSFSAFVLRCASCFWWDHRFRMISVRTSFFSSL